MPGLTLGAPRRVSMEGFKHVLRSEILIIDAVKVETCALVGQCLVLEESIALGSDTQQLA